MREILFRGKTSLKGGWLYGGYFKHLNRTPCPIGDSIKEEDYQHILLTSGFSDWNMPKPLQCYEILVETLGQFTGLYDRNNKRIFENDKVKIYNYWGEVEHENGVVVWSNHDQAFVICIDGDEKYRYGDLGNYSDGKYLEVIE